MSTPGEVLVKTAARATIPRSRSALHAAPTSVDAAASAYRPRECPSVPRATLLAIARRLLFITVGTFEGHP